MAAKFVCEDGLVQSILVVKKVEELWKQTCAARLHGLNFLFGDRGSAVKGTQCKNAESIGKGGRERRSRLR